MNTQGRLDTCLHASRLVSGLLGNQIRSGRSLGGNGRPSWNASGYVLIRRPEASGSSVSVKCSMTMEEMAVEAEPWS